MKWNLVLICVGCLLVLSHPCFGQEFSLEWECDGMLYYVGDMDGDGIGEFAAIGEESDSTLFYDGATHTVKWVTTGMDPYTYAFEAEHNPYSLCPSIDYNDDGIREILFYEDYNRHMIVFDVAHNTALLDVTDPSVYGVYFHALADVDGDGELELVFLMDYYLVGIPTTRVYSTGLPVVSAAPDGSTGQTAVAFSTLHQNFPNPFNPLTAIRFRVDEASTVKLVVYNTRGEYVATLVDAPREAGTYSELWNGKADDGTPLPSGVYFYQLKVGEFVTARKMVMLK
jgi:hypothetical protein